MRMRELYDVATSKQYDLTLRYAAAREMQQHRRQPERIGEPSPEVLRIMYNTRFRRSCKKKGARRNEIH